MSVNLCYLTRLTAFVPKVRLLLLSNLSPCSDDARVDLSGGGEEGSPAFTQTCSCQLEGTLSLKQEQKEGDIKRVRGCHAAQIIAIKVLYNNCVKCLHFFFRSSCCIQNKRIFP